MSNLVQELYDLEGLLEKYAEALRRRIGFNRIEIGDISSEMQRGLERLQNHIDYRIAFINKKLVRLQRRVLDIESRLRETEEDRRMSPDADKERKTA